MKEVDLGGVQWCESLVVVAMMIPPGNIPHQDIRHTPTEVIRTFESWLRTEVLVFRILMTTFLQQAVISH